MLRMLLELGWYLFIHLQHNAGEVLWPIGGRITEQRRVDTLAEYLATGLRTARGVSDQRFRTIDAAKP